MRRTRTGGWARLCSRLLASMLGVLLGLGGGIGGQSVPTARAAPLSLLGPADDMSPATRARDLNGQGQERFDAGDYAGAAADWSRILEVLPENDVNRQERDNALLIAFAAYREAYDKRRVAPGDSARQDAVEFLRRAIVMFDSYVIQFERAYGKGAPISADAAAVGEEMRQLLAEAERELGPAKPEPIIEEEDPPPPIITGQQARRGPSGTGLIVAGSIVTFLGLGALSMIIVGAVRAKQADREYKRANADGDAQGQRDANRKGKVSDALIISGSVLSAAFIAAGVTMLAIGIRRRIKYTAFSPVIGPRFVGVGLRTRF